MKTLLPLLLLGLSVIFFNCEPSEGIGLSTQNGKIVEDRQLLQKIESSSSSIVIDNYYYQISGEAWYNDMPPIEPSSSMGLMTSITFFREDGNPISDDIEVSSIYLFSGKHIWVPEELDLQLNYSENGRISVVARKGPNWERGQKVRPALQIVQASTGNEIFLTLDETPIESAN